jgi:hypothetical protein
MMRMKIVNCAHCSKLTLAAHSSLCADCLIAERREVLAVKAYLEQHPGASMMDVVQKTGIPFRTVRALSLR